ncbi:hypothetical protein M885DRAFT_549354 [Pelagophyceae sp. CCMP2097]|nr:hypothetical protein M885DRAFT_549354 [Pelagophyceae sp. CCMP2097]
MRPFRVRVRRPPTSRRPHVSTSRHMLAQHTETRGYVSASIRSRMSPGTDARSSIRSRMPPNASTPTSSTLRRTSWRHVLPCRPCKNARPQPSSKRLFSRRNDTSVLFRSSAAASAHPPPGPSAFSLRFKDRIASFFASMSANLRFAPRAFPPISLPAHASGIPIATVPTRPLTRARRRARCRRGGCSRGPSGPASR